MPSEKWIYLIVGIGIGAVVVPVVRAKLGK